MIITRISPITGKSNSFDIPVSEEEMYDWYYSDKPIQQSLPDLTPDEREFILSGITPDEWDSIFREDFDEDCFMEEPPF